MGDQGKDTTGDEADGFPPAPRLVVADPRKFSHYALDPDRAKGKHFPFLTLLGYRVRSEADGRTLAAIYAEQARGRFERREFTVRDRMEYGWRLNIVVSVGGLELVTGWILRTDGTLSLATPFLGFAGDAGKEADMALPYLATVRVVNDNYRDYGAHAGDVGVILEVWGDGKYEVEVSDPATGETTAWFTASEPDLELLGEPGVDDARRSAD